MPKNNPPTNTQSFREAAEDRLEAELDKFVREIYLGIPPRKSAAKLQFKALAEQYANHKVEAELESIKSDWSESNAGDRIATRLLQIDLDERLSQIKARKEEGA